MSKRDRYFAARTEVARRHPLATTATSIVDGRAVYSVREGRAVLGGPAATATEAWESAAEAIKAEG